MQAMYDLPSLGNKGETSAASQKSAEASFTPFSFKCTYPVEVQSTNEKKRHAALFYPPTLTLRDLSPASFERPARFLQPKKKQKEPKHLSEAPRIWLNVFNYPWLTGDRPSRVGRTSMDLEWELNGLITLLLLLFASGS